MTMFSIRSRLGRSCCAVIAGLGLAGLAGLAEAAPKHALTLYDEAPKYSAGFSHFDYVNPDAPKGGTLRQAAIGTYDSFNPFIPKGSADGELFLLFDTLGVGSLDEPFSVYGLLAEKMEKAPDNSWARFYLRPQARFHDGTPVTAEDVVFTFETLMANGAPFYRAYYADVAKAVVESERVVRFDFKHNRNRELSLVLSQLPVLPKHWWATRNFAATSLEPPLGSGPYRIESFEPGRTLRYARVEDYWGKDLAVNRGRNNFQNLVIDYYRDSTVALQAFKAGQLDFWLETSAKNWATAYDIEAVRKGLIVRENLPNQQPAGMQAFVFNTRRAQLADRKVRKALALLMDFEWTNRQLFNGAYTRTDSYFENSELASSGLPDAAELKILEPLRGKIPEEIFSEPFSPSRTDGSGIIRENKREAYRLLTEAGWHIENDRMLDGEGKPAKLEFLIVQAEFERVLLPYKRNLADLGIELELRRVDSSQYVNRVRARDYDMIVGNWGQGFSPGNEQREYWHSSSADKPGSRNFAGIVDPAVDTLVEQLISADSRNSLVAHARALDRVLLAGHYVIPNWHITTWRVAYWQQLQHPPTTPPNDLGLMNWWFKPDAAPTSETAEPAAERKEP